jgi:GAF domain-containing protein
MGNRSDHEERRRVRTFQAHGVPDTDEEHEFNLIVHQAAAAVGTRMAEVSLFDRGRQWFKARVGVGLSGIPIASSFPTHGIGGSGLLVVADATLDARFADDPLVTGGPHIRFYAGMTLRLDGVRVGTLSVFDDQPRHSLSALQEDYLTYLANRTVLALKARRGR